MRQMAVASCGSTQVIVFRVAVVPALMLTEEVCTSSSPLYTVKVYVPGSTPAIFHAPVVAVQYCAASFFSPTTYWYPDFMLLSPTPATAPRCDCGTQPAISSPSIHPQSALRANRFALGAAPLSVKCKTDGPWSPRRITSV